MPVWLWMCMCVCVHVCASKWTSESEWEGERASKHTFAYICIDVWDVMRFKTILLNDKPSELIRRSTIDETSKQVSNRPTDQPNRAVLRASASCHISFVICTDIVYYKYTHTHTRFASLFLIPSLSPWMRVSVYTIHVYCDVLLLLFHTLLMRVWLTVSGFFLEIQLKLYQDKFNAVWIGFTPLPRRARQ